jgi:hypothetical protein
MVEAMWHDVRYTVRGLRVEGDACVRSASDEDRPSSFGMVKWHLDGTVPQILVARNVGRRVLRCPTSESTQTIRGPFGRRLQSITSPSIMCANPSSLIIRA